MFRAANESFVDELKIEQALREEAPSALRVREILAKARTLVGLDLHEIAALARVDEPALIEELFAAARYVKDEIYGSRLVLFAPLYISSICKNECVYCAFRVGNRALPRRALNAAEIAEQTKILVDQGHKRVLLVAGESYPGDDFSYVLKAVEAIYSIKDDAGRSAIRRVNVNVAPLTVEQFQQLKATGIGTYQIFQETYHRPTYAAMHLRGPKRDYDWRVNAPGRAMQGGIDDVGIGFLLGLYDWKYELLAMMQHIRHLEKTAGVGPHTISVPRMEPAAGSSLAGDPPHRVSDGDFKKLVAILRLAVPYTGIIMSTRENAAMRRETYALGVSQISAGSRTDPGGYEADGGNADAGQFQLGDHRSLDEVVRDCAQLGYVPSFCTACYRMGRTGADFMDLAKPGLIKKHCGVNALSTFLEYLLDYASAATRRAGERLIEKRLTEMDEPVRKIAVRLIEHVRAKKRDVMV